MTKLPVPQLLAWPLVLALAAVGCNSTDAGEVDPCLAFLRINLEVGDAVINEVYYEISGNGIEPREGTIDTSAPGSTASVEEFGLPPGEDYLVEMVARSVDGKLLCGGTAEFDVSVGPSTEVDVIMHCKGAEEFGGVRVNGELNICTELDKVVVKPLQTSSGYSLSVEAEASDQEDDSFAYSWTATGGSFDDPDAAKTIYTCGEPGEEVITIEVSDDDFEYCVDFWDVHVNCVDDNGAGGSGGSGSGGAGGSAGGGGTGGAAGGGGSGGAAGGAGGSAGGGGSAGNGGNGGSAGSAGSGGSAGSAGSGGSAGSAGNGGSSGGGGSGGSIPPECLVSLSVQ